MDIESLVNELMDYLKTDEGHAFHIGPDEHLCRFVDEMVPALAQHPAVKLAVGQLLAEGKMEMAGHIVAHLVFDLARFYALKGGQSATPTEPPVQIDENIWGSGWDSGGDL